MLFYEKAIEPYLSKTKTQQESDVVGQQNSVIIAGFGRFGQIVGRLMLANRIGTTVLDIDSNQVEEVRKFGFKVFFGI